MERFHGYSWFSLHRAGRARGFPDLRKSIAFPAPESNGALMRNPLLASSLFGLTGVVLGAFGAHALRDTLAAHGTASTWETAVHYHLFHAVALLAVGLARPPAAPWLRRAGFAWGAGITLFSGSLYLLALGGPKWLGPVTPLGGLGFIAGWAAVFVHAWASPNPDRPS